MEKLPIMSVLPREFPELYAKPYSLRVNFQSLSFLFFMHALCVHAQIYR